MVEKNRLQSFAALVAAAFLGGVLSLAVGYLIPRASAQNEKAGQTIRAGRFELVDSDGHVRAALFTDDKSSAKDIPLERTSFVFYDQNQTPLIDLSTETKRIPMSALTLRAPQKNRSISLRAQNVEPGISISQDQKTVWSAP